MKKLKRTYTRCAGLTALVLLALLIAGSFADLPISRFLYPGHELLRPVFSPPSASCRPSRCWPAAACC